MEIKKATIVRTDAASALVLGVTETNLYITLTEDNPNNVKTVFNTLLKELKNGFFEFELDDEQKDLYHHICNEYIVQLNTELKVVYQELVDYKLIIEAEDSD